MSTTNIKRGDTKARFIDTLTVNGVPVNLTGANVKFLMRRKGDPALEKNIDAAAVITNPPGLDGDVEYDATADDISKSGSYDQEWEVTFVDGKILTFPNNGYNTVNILDDLP